MRDGFRLRIQEAQIQLRSQWEGFQAALRRRNPDLFSRAMELVRSYERLAGLVYRARVLWPPQDPFRRRVEDAFSGVSQEMSALSRSHKEGYVHWVLRYRALWRENLPLFLFTAALFTGSLFLGWHLSVSEPDLAPVVIPQSMLEVILDRQRWFDDLQKNPFLGGLQIALNNIKVCVNVFALGALFGIGALFLLAFNGIFFGAIMGFCFVNDFQEQLESFVVGHGPLELSLIVASAFAGFVIGRVFFMRPVKLLKKRLALAASDAGCLLAGILPWLTLAAVVEAFVSPWPQIPTDIKLGLGCVVALCFWAWTFWPLPRSASQILTEVRKSE